MDKSENMYIYQLPFDINRELCRLLDMDDTWKELAGEQMMYSPFHIIEMEQIAKRQEKSPTQQLFTRWGQLNHNVGELFILLYKMKHVPALRCMVPVVDQRFHRLLSKLDKERSPRNDVNGNIRISPNVKSCLIPLPVLEQSRGQNIPAAQNVSSTTHRETSTEDSSSSSSSTRPSAEDKIVMKVSLIPKMSYEELTAATDNWSENNKLGKGGFGVVYKGVYQHCPVAVKKLEKIQLSQEWIREMSLNQYRSVDILPLFGYSINSTGTEACLVYELMTGGSLYQWIHRHNNQLPALTWPQRYNIALRVARGLQFLHSRGIGKVPLIHGDIKPGNILLDQCMMPKIGDFGLARRGPNGNDETHIQMKKRVDGTMVYLPPECLDKTRTVSLALDTYSYGVVLFELCSGRPAARQRDKLTWILLSREIHAKLKDPYFTLAEMEEPEMKNSPRSNPDLCLKIMEIGVECTRPERKDRPSMLQVYKQLEALEFVGKSCPSLI